MEKVGLNTIITFNGKKDSTQKIKSEDVIIVNNLVTKPDEFQKSEPVKKKRNIFKKLCLATLAAVILIYGGIVLKRKLSKPSLEEVQKCFRQIFEKDLSNDEIKTLLDKYKEICREDKTENFVKKIIEQLKKDYGIENVKTDLTVTKLTDNKISTARKQTRLGQANPTGEINIMPSTSSDNIIRSVQEQTFNTGFHEIKHMKQFAEAYRTNPDEFAKAILFNYEGNIKEIDAVTEKIKKEIEDLAQESKNKYPHLSINEIRRQIMKNSGFKNEADIRENVIKKTLKDIRKTLDEKFGKLEPYKQGTEEYKKGMEYIKAYEHYPDPEKDYQAYKNNLLEKEAFQIGEYAQKIYKYISSVWKL